ncbi:MAG TPA: hypothetical protein VJQ09_04175 [Candidatus Limnocylindria bacterium]|nr:hypothetical protein [Candidatus Limnocylindria bacterium]
MGRLGRTIVAGFDAVVMAGAAYVETGGQFAATPASAVLWGSAAAAALCALVIFLGGAAFLAWAAIGYILFGALLTAGGPHWPLVALSIALMPLVPRPRGSVWLGVGIALVAAIVARLAIGLVL